MSEARHAIVVRPFDDQNTAGLLALMNEVSAPGVFSYVEDLSPHPKNFHSLQGQDFRTWVALLGSRVVGSMGCYFQQVQTLGGIQTVAFVQELRIHPEFRGKGLSETLGQQLMAQVRAEHPKAIGLGVVERKNKAVLDGVYPRWKHKGILDFKPLVAFTVFMLPTLGPMNRGSQQNFIRISDSQLDDYLERRNRSVRSESLRATLEADPFRDFVTRAESVSDFQCYSLESFEAGYALWNQTQIRSYRLQMNSSLFGLAIQRLLNATPEGKIPIRYLHDLWVSTPSVANYRQLIQDGLVKCRKSGGSILCVAAADISPLEKALKSFTHFKTQMYLVKDGYSPELNLGDSIYLEAALG